MMPPRDATPFPGELPAGTLLVSRYEVVRTLGRGGFAFTYQAFDRHSGETVAIKEVFPSNCNRTGRKVEPSTPDAEWVLANSPRWLRDEARLLRGFHDPSIVKVRETFEEHETVYFVMEFIDGVNLEEEAKEAGERLAPVVVTKYLRKILLALKIVHGDNVLHRDLKPSNVMHARDGRIVLIDFGAAREDSGASHTASTLMYTPGYAAPEQIFGGHKTFATDLFAVGATGFRLLTGKRYVIDKDANNEEMKALIDAGHVSLVRTIGWALQREQDDRPANATMMFNALEGIQKPGPGVFDRTRRRTPRRPAPRPPRPPRRTPQRKQWLRRRRPDELSNEARRLAEGSRWPLAALVATPALIYPFVTGAACLAVIVLAAALIAARAEMRKLLKQRLTSATALFILPRLLRRLPVWLVGCLLALIIGLIIIAAFAAIGAAIAAAYAAADVLLHGKHLDHTSFMPGFLHALPRTVVFVPILMLLAWRMNGETALVRRAALGAAGVTEGSVATLWVLGIGVPALALLLASCHTWAPFRDYEQALLWAEARVPPITYADNAIVRLRIKSQIHGAAQCKTATRRYSYEIHQVGKRSFLVNVGLDRGTVEQAAREYLTANASNAQGQVVIAALLLGRLDARVSRRVREITLEEGDLERDAAGNVSLSDRVLSMVLPRPHGPVTNGTAARALAATRRFDADSPLRAAAAQLANGEGSTNASSNFCS